jgi:RNA polymerase sigma factor (sigma-70 family)
MTAIAEVKSDQQLLQNYLAGSPDAFAELVSRHVNLVYSAARRQVRDAHLADDVTQAVFLLLAKKAPGFSSGTILPAWLHRATRYCAANALRMNANRLRHERRAAEMNSQTMQAEPQADWSEISPLLDEAINRLGGKDRQAIVLRYLEDKSHDEVATNMGLTPAAARKRVERAVLKLRNLLCRSGAESTAPGLAAMLAGRAIESAPQQLILKSSAVASMSAASPTSMAIMKGATKMIFWTQCKTIAMISVAGLAVTAGVAIALDKEANGNAVTAAAVTPAETLNARQTLVKLAAAIKSGDADYVRTHTSFSTPGQKMVVDNQARTCASVAKFQHAYADAFGQAAADQLPAMVGPTEIPPGTKVTETGDTATADFGVGGKIKLVRQEGVWKLDYSSLGVNALPLSEEQLAGYLNRTLVAMDQCTLALQFGKYKTPDDCLTDLRNLTIQAAHEPAATPTSNTSDHGASNLGIDSKLRSRLVGRYQLTPNFIFTVDDRDGHLMVGITNQSTQEVFPDSPTRWSYHTVAAMLEFKLPNTGPAESLVLHQNGVEQTAYRMK